MIRFGFDNGLSWVRSRSTETRERFVLGMLLFSLGMTFLSNLSTLREPDVHVLNVAGMAVFAAWLAARVRPTNENLIIIVSLMALLITWASM